MEKPPADDLVKARLWQSLRMMSSPTIDFGLPAAGAALARTSPQWFPSISSRLADLGSAVLQKGVR
jgi:hypothetical protein